MKSACPRCGKPVPRMVDNMPRIDSAPIGDDMPRVWSQPIKDIMPRYHSDGTVCRGEEKKP